MSEEIISDEEIKEAKEKGELQIVTDGSLKIIAYIYKNHIYIDDVIEL